MNKTWILKEKKDEVIEREKYIQQKFNVNRLVSIMLANKELKNDEEIETFLNPSRNSFGNPFEMPDMDKAIKRIKKAIKNKEKIIIYGDYDADGITSSTILKRFFKDIDVNVDVYIPNRLTEGYGLNNKAIEYIAQNSYNLIITVDCGITAIEEVEYAKSLGMDVIITDHHEPGEDIPKAVAVIDCKRKDSKYYFRELAGCGVAFKITQALTKELKIDENTCLKYLDFACIGTISDIVPLVSENRVIAKLGLMLVQQLRNVGIRELVRIAGIKNIDATSISFGIAPRINACGRMGHHEEALELFLTDDPIKARKLAKSLDEYNINRQNIEKRIYNEALELAEKENDSKCIVLAKRNWHHGIIGIVSSKITETFYKPSVLICIEGEEAKGSGRSIKGFDLHKAVTDCSKNLSHFGGHGMAIGLSLKTKDIDNFKKEFINYSDELISEEMLKQTIEIDEEITSKDIDIEQLKQMKIMEPYGEGNVQPIIIYKNLRINSIRTLSEGKHLKLSLLDGNISLDAIGFNLGEVINQYQIDDKVDVIGNIEVNTFNNIDKAQIVLKDIRKSINN